MESTLKSISWEKGNDKTVKATWYGFIEHEGNKILLFSIRPAGGDKTAGYFLYSVLSRLLKTPDDSKLYDSVEDARDSAESLFSTLISAFYVENAKVKSKSTGNDFFKAG